nr:NAD(P)H-dependent oxidoreductase [Mucilaginibacter terrae]
MGYIPKGPYKAYDFIEPYLRGVLGFLGMTDVTVYRVEGISIAGLKETALEKGINSINI